MNDLTNTLKGLTVEKIVKNSNSKNRIIFKEKDEEGYKRSVLVNNMSVEDISPASQIEDKLLKLEEVVKKSKGSWSENERSYIAELCMTVARKSEEG